MCRPGSYGSTPLPQVLAALPVQRLKRNTLFVDVLSVKEFPKTLLLREVRPRGRPAPGPACGRPLLAPSGHLACTAKALFPPPHTHTACTPLLQLPPEMDILCTHPMFGPDSGKVRLKGRRQRTRRACCLRAFRAGSTMRGLAPFHALKDQLPSAR